MGFLDKAKKMAEQAQTKLDDAQKNFNSGQQGQSGGGPAVQYDAHGRPIASEPAATTPGAPPMGTPEPAAATAPMPDPGAPGVPATEPVSSPAAPAADPDAPAAAGGPAPPSPKREDTAPPKLSSGDPLAG